MPLKFELLAILKMKLRMGGLNGNIQANRPFPGLAG